MIESAGDADYFKLELAESMNLYIYAGSIAYKDASDEWPALGRPGGAGTGQHGGSDPRKCA